MNIEHHAEAGKIADLLFPIARTVEVKDAYWIAMPDGSSYYSDEGAEWCRDCGHAMVRHLRKKDRRHREDYRLDGGWACEHETPPHCAGCGAKLDAILLAYGAIEELQHFSENPPDPRDPNEVYEVREMLTALEYADERHRKEARDAIKIGRRLAAALGG